MATADELTALLAVGCSWCGARPGETCAPASGKRQTSHPERQSRRRVVLRTLDGGCHDARWRRALEQPAPVIGAAVEELHAERCTSRVLEPAGGPVERPW